MHAITGWGWLAATGRRGPGRYGKISGVSFIHWLQNLSGIDWVQVVSALASALAAALAVIAIRQSARDSRENQEALTRERRINFELDTLDKIAAITAPLFTFPIDDYQEHERIAHRIWMLCTVLGEGELPLLRGLVRADTIPEVEERIDGKELEALTETEFQQAVQKEIVEAIGTRLAARQSIKPPDPIGRNVNGPQGIA